MYCRALAEIVSSVAWVIKPSSTLFKLSSLAGISLWKQQKRFHSICLSPDSYVTLIKVTLGEEGTALCNLIQASTSLIITAKWLLTGIWPPIDETPFQCQMCCRVFQLFSPFCSSLQVFPQSLCARGLWTPKAAFWWQQVGPTSRMTVLQNHTHCKEALKPSKVTNCQRLQNLYSCPLRSLLLLKLICNADGVYRGEKLINLKQIADEALEKCSQK